MSARPLLSLSGVRRSYGERFALAIDHLEVLVGETLCLVGPVGAGKSTLLRILAGLERPDAGSVRWEGQVMEDGEWPLAVRRRIALVAQRPVLLRGTVGWNVEYGLRLRGVRDAAARGAAMLDRLGLAPLAAQSAATLSGGQTQLVALARALVLAPDVLLLDEPTAHLDPAGVALAERAVSEVRAERGATVVWATHNLFQARRVADRAALLLDGRLVEVAPERQFFESPSDPRTMDFVQGRMIY